MSTIQVSTFYKNRKFAALRALYPNTPRKELRKMLKKVKIEKKNDKSMVQKVGHPPTSAR